MSKVWPTPTINEVCRVVNGGTPKTKVSEYWDGLHNWITPAEMGKRKSPYVKQTDRTLTEKGLAHCSAKMLPEFSVILSARAPIGHLVINEVPMASNQGCKGLVPSKNLLHKFLYYFLLANVELLNSLGTGTTFKELSATKLKGVRIPLPSLPEQKRIVEILDEAFEAIDKAIANTERNIRNAEELLLSCLDAVFLDNQHKWPRIKLMKLTSKIGSGSTPRGGAKSYKTEGISLIRSLNVHDRSFRTEKLAHIDKMQAEKLIWLDPSSMVNPFLCLFPSLKGSAAGVSQSTV